MRKLFVIGDSISIQYGPYLQNRIRDKFDYDRLRGEEQALADLDKPVGANGGDSSRVLDFLQEENYKGRRFDILLINCGLHDIKVKPADGSKQLPLEEYRANMQQIAKLALDMADAVVWIRTTDAVEDIHNARSKGFHRFHADVVAYNEVADHVLAQWQIPCIDLYGFTRTFGVQAYCDHVHFTDEVRGLQAAYIAGFLESSFG